MNAFKRITLKRKNYLTIEILGKKKEELPEEKKKAYLHMACQVMKG